MFVKWAPGLRRMLTILQYFNTSTWGYLNTDPLIACLPLLSDALSKPACSNPGNLYHKDGSTLLAVSHLFTGGFLSQQHRYNMSQKVCIRVFFDLFSCAIWYQLYVHSCHSNRDTICLRKYVHGFSLISFLVLHGINCAFMLFIDPYSSGMIPRYCEYQWSNPEDMV